MSATDKVIKPPTSGSAFLQFMSAAFRQENMVGSQQRSDFISEDDEDMVHVNKDGEENVQGKLNRQELIHGLDIHSDDEEELTNGIGHHRAKHHHEPGAESTISTDSDLQKSMSAVSLDSGREKMSLAEKLQRAFGYPDVEELVADYSCYLASSIILPGHLYLTTNHICFYANLPSNQDVAEKEGFLYKKSNRTKQFHQYWFVLKNDVLSYYDSRTDLYSPRNIINLKHAYDAQPVNDNNESFTIYTVTREYTFRTDSELSRSDWLQPIKKSIFRASMVGGKVKIAIPLGIITELDMNAMAFAEAIHIKANDQRELAENEEFYFAYFEDAAKTLKTLKAQVQNWRQTKSNRLGERLINDSTTANTSATKHPSLSSHDGRRISRNLMPPDHNKSISRSNSPGRSEPSSDTEESERDKSRHSLSFSIRGTTSWLMDKSGFDATEEGTANLSEKAQVAFRRDFSLPDSEVLSAIVYGYHLRMLPAPGRIYLSDNYICFKSKIISLISKAPLIVPLEDVHKLTKVKGTAFNSGLTLFTKTSKEISFEFSSADVRNTIYNTLMDRITPEAQDRRMKQRALLVAETPSAELDDPMGYRALDLNDEPVHIDAIAWGTHPKLKTLPPMRITCLTIGSRGDVQPYIALCKRLMKDGHRCRISTHGEYKEWIEGHGIEFGLVGGDPGELIELCVENGMFTVSFIREGLKRFRGWLDELMVSAWEACQDTDVLIESPSAMAGIHIAEKLDIPYFRAFPFPWSRTRNFPHPFAVPEHNLGRSYNYMTYIMIEQVFWKGISGQVNRWRKETLGLPSTNLEKMDAHHVPFLYAWSPNIVPGPFDWPSWVHVTGYWFLDNPDLKWTPPDDLVAFLNADPKRKPVYIGFGSMVVSDPDGMTKTIIEAVVKSGVRAIISKGWSDRLTSQDDPAAAAKKAAASEETAVPSSIFMLKSVPHDWLFPQLSGCVHHGGAGTAAAGFRAGIPTVIKPFFGDQFFWAQCIEESGVGVWCHDLTVKKLTTALETITRDEKMITKARLLGEKIRQEDGVGEAIKYFYHDLEIAKPRSRRQKEKAQEMRHNLEKVEDDWLYMKSSTSGGNSGGEESESTTGLNVLSASEEDMTSNASESTTPQLTAFATGSYRGGHSRSTSSTAEPLTSHLHSSTSEPTPDRMTEYLTQNDASAEEIAARFAATQLPGRSPIPFFSSAFGQGESLHEKTEKAVKDKEKESKIAKRTSTARKMIDVITTKATHMTGYFAPSSSTASSSADSSSTSVTPVPASSGSGAPIGSSGESRPDGQVEAARTNNNSASIGSTGSTSSSQTITGIDKPPSTKSSHKAMPSVDAPLDASKTAIGLTMTKKLR